MKNCKNAQWNTRYALYTTNKGVRKRLFGCIVCNKPLRGGTAQIVNHELACLGGLKIAGVATKDIVTRIVAKCSKGGEGCYEIRPYCRFGLPHNCNKKSKAQEKKDKGLKYLKNVIVDFSELKERCGCLVV